MSRPQLRKIWLPAAVCAVGLLCALPPAAIADPPAITQEADALSTQALDLLNSGNLSGAATDYSQLIQRYPNSEKVPEAMFRLGYIEYMQGDYDGAVSTLQRITSPPASPDIKAAADALIPQVYTAKAAKLAPDDPARKQAFQDAFRRFGEYIHTYPQSPEVESANYGRASAAYQIQNYSAAEQSLRENLKKFPQSDSILDSEDLLAVVLTAQASKTLQDNGDQEDAMRKYDEALGFLADIIERHTDVALANDAQYQIGEVLFQRGNSEQGEKRQKDLENAILAYRAVLPKDAMVQAQQARAASIDDQHRQAIIMRDLDQAQAIQRVEDRANAKLEALKNAPDETLKAQLRIASCYFMLQKYDEARVLLHFLEGFAQDDDDKKQIAYYITLTYAAQGLTDKAVAAFNDFESKYKNDPLGENLPLAMGAAFMNPKVNQPDKAISYFDQEISLYPNSALATEALSQEANALIGLKRFDEAQATYQKFLQTNPPPAQAAQAEEGIATVDRETGKMADAIAQYQKVAKDYDGTPQAEESAFYAAGLESTLDPKSALPLLQAYVQKYPDGRFAGQALMLTGQVQATLGDRVSAMQTYRNVIARYPQSDLAPQAYFQQASILGGQNKNDDMIKLLRQFIHDYPNDKDIFYAYDTIGQTQLAAAKVTDAIATYAEMADQHADNPMAPSALYKVAELWRKQADSQGRYLALNEAQRKDWSKDLDSSIAAAEKLVGQFPDSDQVGLALKTLLGDQKMYLDAQLKKPGDIDNYFHGLADKFASNPSARSRILFTLATFTYESDPAKGVQEMAAAYNPSFVYAPEDLDLYGQALIDQGNPDKAFDIYEKIANDYPIPANVEPAQAQPAIQEAQATALFGMGSALDKEGKTSDAAKLYAELKATYPWSPKVVEANFGIAKSLVQQNKLDDASKLLVGIVANRNASADLRAHAFLLIGDIQQGKGNILAAIDSYLKTAAFYGGVPDAAAEGLWKGGQLLEKQAGTLTEQTSPKRSEQLAKAVSAYNDIVTKYPNSQYARQAQDRLSVLPAPKS